MYSYEEIEDMRKREQELVTQIATLREELRHIRKPLYARTAYEKAYGKVREKPKEKTEDELREYRKIKQREWRAKHRNEK